MIDNPTKREIQSPGIATLINWDAVTKMRQSILNVCSLTNGYTVVESFHSWKQQRQKTIELRGLGLCVNA